MTSFMPWSDRFILGINSIDEQHHWLVDATNRLYAQVESQTQNNEALREILEGLVDYTVNHFILEEELFDRLKYPETDAHKAEHDDLTRQAIQLLLDFEKGEAVSEEALEFLKGWLMHHILRVDKAYVPFLQEHGIK
ncbi:MAG: bacteriohemerythrin [Zoogloeaceae bacterium]|nr:bacteriohemerythrin [Zoogloeaceae bacterium]